MATDPTSIKICKGWLDILAALCVVGKEGPLTEAKKLMLARELCELFPSAAFVNPCARACAKGDYFPGFDTLQARIGEWWEMNKPGSPVRARLFSDEGANLSGMDLHWFNYFHKRQQENFAPVRTGAPASSRAHVLSLIRTQSPAAWGVITGNTSRRISEATDDERAAVADSARRAREAMQPPREPRAHSLDQQMAAVRASPALAKALPAPSAEVLAQREANPLVQAARRSADELFS